MQELIQVNQDELMEEVPDNQELFESVDGMDGIVEIQESSTDATIPAKVDPANTYLWTITNFSKVTEPKFYSEKFEIGTYLWRILIFPKGNKADSFSVYLDAAEATYTPVNMSPRASFKLILVNRMDPEKSISKDTAHTFTAAESDWGFTQFCPLSDVLDPRKGYLVNDTLELRVEINVQKDERYSYDSRKETGCVGLKNQGATCYMNSLLQYLFHVPYFRKAVYHMPTPETDEPSESLPVALQSLFYKLQYSKTSVSTKALTKSFGWGTYDSFMQHDVQELNRVLCEKLEEKMKGTKVERVINELFEGHTSNFIQCMHVDYKSTRKESFMDLQLDVKGCKDIYDSFNKYCEIETLEGQNQYKAEGYGLQDARKGVLFESFPPVLQLQLKRFEYDFQRDTMVKINDRYEFFEELDLDVEDGKYLAGGADRSVRNLYKLHSVLVHSGGVHGGHYYAFIRPDGKTWLKFDDERVSVEDKKKALDEQFGGEDDTPNPAPGYGTNIKITKYSNAYMLVYVRVSDWGRIHCEVTKNDIAEHLRKRLEADREEKENRHKEKAEAHLYCYVKLVRDEDLRDQIGHSRYLDLVDTEKVKRYRVQKQLKFLDFKRMIAEEVGVAPENQRYWTWARRQNATYRPVKALREEEEASHVVTDLREYREQLPVSKRSLMDIVLFLEVPFPDKTVPLAPLSNRHIMLFLKFYEPMTESMTYVGRINALKSSRVADLFPQFAALAQLPPATDFEVYEEVKYEPNMMIPRLEEQQSLAEQAQLEDGDILVFQRALSPQEAGACHHPTVESFFVYLCNRKRVLFKRLDDPKEEGIWVELMREMDYDQVSQALALRLGLDDPTKLRFTSHNNYSHQPQRTPLKFRAAMRVEQMVQHAHHVHDTLYYEVLDMPLYELEQLKTLKVAFHNEKTEMASEHQIRLPRDSTVAAVLGELRKALGEEYDGREFRFIEVYNSKVYKVCDPGHQVEQINDQYWSLRAEVVSEEEASMRESDRLVHVCHFHADKENASHIINFGDPFFILVRETDTVADVKQHIRTKLQVSEEEFAKWKVAFISIRQTPEYLSDSELLLPRFAKPYPGNSLEGNYLGLEHEDKTPRRPHTYHRYYERPVKIYN